VSSCRHGRKKSFCRFCELKDPDPEIPDVFDKSDLRVANLQRQAFQKQAELERERQARLRQAEADAREKKKEELERKKKLLEAAYDGDANGIREILEGQRREAISLGHDVISRGQAVRQEMALIETKDGSGNSCVSEAANSGAAEVIKLLLERGADINSRGAYNRTPLFRAAFAGNEEVVLLLLKSGADPRLRADDGQTAFDVAATPTIAKTLSSWDLGVTEKKAAANRAARRRSEELQLAGIRAEKNEIGLKMDAIKEQYEVKQKELEAAFASLSQLRSDMSQLHPEDVDKEIASPDASGKGKQEAMAETSTATAPSLGRREKLKVEINTADLRLEATKIQAEKIAQELEEVRANLRAKILEEGQFSCDEEEENSETDKNEENDARSSARKNTDLASRARGGGDGPNKRESKIDETESQISMNIQFRALDDALMKDRTGRIKKSRKCPLLMDVTDRSATFLKYRDTNYINALDPVQMQPATVRIALLGALRYGKPIVFDMMELDRHGAVEATLEAIRPNLFQDLLDLSLLRDDSKIENLIKEEDGEQYRISKFTQDAFDKFKCIFVTKNRFPAPSFLSLVYPIKVN